MKRFAVTASLLCLGLALAGCQTTGGYDDAYDYGQGDSLANALTFGAGTSAAKPLVLAPSDRRVLASATAYALSTVPSGNAWAWNNPLTGAQGRISPRTHFTDDSGAECRDFEQSVKINGTEHTASAIACRTQNDRKWELRL